MEKNNSMLQTEDMFPGWETDITHEQCGINHNVIKMGENVL